MTDLVDLLRHARTIAIVGCSDHRSRTSNGIARYLRDAGYRIVPVNPNHAEVLGERCYPDLQSLPDDVAVDIVTIFRRPEHAAEMVRQAVAFARARGQRPAVWTQLGVSTRDAERLAEEAGLPYIKNRCIMTEHAYRLAS